MIRLAIVGVGWAGRRQIEAVTELACSVDPRHRDRIRVVMLVDTDQTHLKHEARSLGIDQTTVDLAIALAHPEVDAISIATPHQLHRQQVVTCLAAEKPTMVEKPMATDVASATEMIEASEATETALFVAENEVYTPFVDTARALLPEIGQLIHASIRGLSGTGRYAYPGRRRWLTVPEEGGTGVWALNGIHTVAQLRAILGEVRTVYMRERHDPSFEGRGIEGTMAGLLTMSNGALVDIVQTAEIPMELMLNAQGDRGQLRVTEKYAELVGARKHRTEIAPGTLSSYAREMLAFADWIEGHGRVRTDGYSERRSLAVVQAGYESAASGQSVDLFQRFGDL